MSHMDFRAIPFALPEEFLRSNGTLPSVPVASTQESLLSSRQIDGLRPIWDSWYSDVVRHGKGGLYFSSLISPTNSEFWFQDLVAGAEPGVVDWILSPTRKSLYPLSNVGWDYEEPSTGDYLMLGISKTRTVQDILYGGSSAAGWHYLDGEWRFGIDYRTAQHIQNIDDGSTESHFYRELLAHPNEYTIYFVPAWRDRSLDAVPLNSRQMDERKANVKIFECFFCSILMTYVGIVPCRQDTLDPWKGQPLLWAGSNTSYQLTEPMHSCLDDSNLLTGPQYLEHRKQIRREVQKASQKRRLDRETEEEKEERLQGRRDHYNDPERPEWRNQSVKHQREKFAAVKEAEKVDPALRVERLAKVKENNDKMQIRRTRTQKDNINKRQNKRNAAIRATETPDEREKRLQKKRETSRRSKEKKKAEAARNEAASSSKLTLDSWVQDDDLADDDEMYE